MNNVQYIRSVFLYLLIFFLLIHLDVYAQKEKIELKDNIDSIHVNLPEIIIKKNVYKADSIRFNEYAAYIFQKEYGDGYFKKEIEKGLLISGIDLDMTIIREVDSLLTKDNIIKTDRKFMQFRFQEMHAMKETNPTAYDWVELEKCETEYWREFEMNMNKESWSIHKRDRQYIGYINKQGEKIVRIYLIDFGDDPHHIRDNINQKLINGFTDSDIYPHVWIMHYNITTKQLNMNENI
ncbi:MAG: hypothetical protein FWD60_11025 [Candidatus Azobacteroides sp.]|nr:hypothetical protein [Candidatus Azobacteroides sp.]